MKQKNELLERITMNPAICHGKPTVRNMRYPVTLILDLLSAGMTPAEIIEDYPALELQDIAACLKFASKLAAVTTISKIAA
jgi:uncharacterized protein (DUF433 family)